uniref:MIT domain-containing protein n=1 Tax=Pyrodinium bahamense TaxID=73915 RepID=A0A7R9ZY54_9DINO
MPVPLGHRPQLPQPKSGAPWAPERAGEQRGGTDSGYPQERPRPQLPVGKGGATGPGGVDGGRPQERPRPQQPLAGKGGAPWVPAEFRAGDGGHRPGRTGSMLECIDIDSNRANAKQLDAMERGELLVDEGRALAKQGEVEKARAKYREGLRYLMETVPETEDSSKVSEVDKVHLQRISDYMSEMEALSVPPQIPGVMGAPAVMGGGASFGAGDTGDNAADGASRRSRKSRWH